MSLLDDFLVRALLAGIAVALAAGPLGCFVVWRRMAYFGDATAHAALLGVTLALATSLPVVAGVALAALAMALTVSLAAGRSYAADTLLGVASHAALAAGLVALSFMPGVRVDLIGYLFGDILAVTRTDLAVIFAGAALIVALLAWRWQSLLLATLNRLHGEDDPRRRGALLDRLRQSMDVTELRELVPESKQKLAALLALAHAPPRLAPPPRLQDMPEPITFFITARQKARLLEHLRQIDPSNPSAALVRLRPRGPAGERMEQEQGLVAAEHTVHGQQRLPEDHVAPVAAQEAVQLSPGEIEPDTRHVLQHDHAALPDEIRHRAAVAPEAEEVPVEGHQQSEP